MHPLPEPRRVAIRPFHCLQQGAERLNGNYMGFVGVGALVVLGMQVPLGLVLGPLLVGTHLCFLDKERTGTMRVARIFDGFQDFLQAWIIALLQFAAMMALLLPGYLILVAGALVLDGAGSSDAAVGAFFVGFMAVFMLLTVVSYMLFGFAPHLMAERGLSGFDAVKVSIRAALLNFPGLLGLWCLLFFLCYAAAACCVVPFFFVFPYCLAALVEAFRRVFGEPPAEVTAPGDPLAAA